MGNSNYFDELIVSYLSNELNTEEEAFVLAWINSSEHNKRYFEDLRSTWNLLAAEQTAKDINIDDEWNKFKQTIGPKSVERFTTDSKTYENETIEEAGPGIKTKIRNLVVSAAVAASIIVVVALGWKFLSNDPGVVKPAIAAVTNETKEPASLFHSEVNTTDRPRTVVLPDGSRVKLYGRSKISYYDPFTANKRDITLLGKASFKVAKDKTRPFTVISGDISTTALGTRFTVTAFKNEKNITVRLYEGKVVVKSSILYGRKLKDDYYLVPGDELVYDNRSLTATIRPFRTTPGLTVKTMLKKEVLAADNPSVPDFGNGTWYMFNNEPLEHVFDQLERMFNVDIVYSKKDIANVYFIGSFNLTESLDDVLKQIAAPNNLKVIKKNNKIIITK